MGEQTPGLAPRLACGAGRTVARGCPGLGAATAMQGAPARKKKPLIAKIKGFCLVAGALPKERRNPLSQLNFRLSWNGSCPQSCPQPCFVSALVGRRDSTYRLALGRPANPSKPTNPTSRPWSTCPESRPLPFSLARAWTVGKPSKAYKPHQPAQPVGLRVAPLLFHWLAFRRKKTLQNPPNPTKCLQSDGTLILCLITVFWG